MILNQAFFNQAKSWSVSSNSEIIEGYIEDHTSHFLKIGSEKGEVTLYLTLEQLQAIQNEVNNAVSNAYKIEKELLKRGE
jgi:hypothetical protein